MKTKTKFIRAVMPAIILSVFLSQCKSPEVKTEAEAVKTEIADTATAPEVVREKKSDIVPLTVTVTNLKSPNAPVEMSIYRKADKFLDKGAQLKKFRFNPVNGKLTATLDSIPYGEFAIALYQDINSSGVIDKNGIGLPTEPYAFSNNYKPRFKKPSFDNCKFNYTAKENNISIALLK
jgi:uncharacterized protein (DUF2141 family)